MSLGAVSMKSNILIIYASSALGGPGKGIIQSILYAKSEQHYVLSSFIPEAGTDSEFSKIAKKNSTNYIPIIQKKTFDFRLIGQVYTICKANNIDIIQTHGYKGHIIALVLSKVLGIKWIAWAHGWTNENAKIRLYNKVERFCLKRADAAVAVSPNLHAIVSNIRGKKRKTHMILNAVGEGELSYGIGGKATRQKHGIKKGNTVIGCFGRLSPEKGQEILLEAAALILPEHPEIKIILVGEGQERNKLESLADRLNISNCVIFCGYQQAMQDYYEAVDIVVLPSHSEGLPNVALEGMMFKRAVVSTNVGGVGEIICNGENGWIVPPGDCSAMADCLKRVISNPELREKIAKSGYHSLYPKFSPEKRALDIACAHNELLNGDE